MINLFTKKRNKKGFTLIELIVVIAILGVLAAIAIPRFAGVQDDAALKADRATAQTVVSAIQVGEASGTYTISGTKIMKGTTDVTSSIVSQLVTDKYLVTAPVLKSGSNALVVTVVDGAITKVTGGLATTTQLYPAP